MPNYSDIKLPYESWRVLKKHLECASPHLKDYFPDFLVISPSKTGKTWLFENLRRNPDIYAGNKQNTEINYFTVFWHTHDINWYLSQFIQPANIVGDVSVNYLSMSRVAIDLISQIKPDVKLILIMRNPVYRSWSQARHFFKYQEGNFANYQGEIKDVTTEQWVESITDSWHLYQGDYFGNLCRWLDFFPKTQIYLDLYERIEEDSKALITNVLQFLGASTNIDFQQLPLSEKVHKGIDLQIPVEIEQILRVIHKKRTEKLANFLQAEFSLSIPTQWTKSMEGKEESLKIVESYSEQLWKNVDYWNWIEKKESEVFFSANRENTDAIVSKPIQDSQEYKVQKTTGIIDREVKLEKEEKLEKAICGDRFANANESNLSWYYYGLGDALAQRGDLDEAVAAYRYALKLNSNSSHLYVSLGNALNKQNFLDEALACYEKAIKLNPSLSLVEIKNSVLEKLEVQLLLKQITCHASSTMEEIYGPQNLFWGYLMIWHSQSLPQYPEWLEFELPQPQKLQGISIKPQQGHYERAPATFTIMGSKDKQEWESLLSVSDYNWVSDNWQHLDFERANDYKYYKMEIFANNGDTEFLTIERLAPIIDNANIKPI